MKNILLVLLAINLLDQSDLLSAQEYKPLAVDGAHWVIAFHDEQTVIPIDGLWDYYCYGDTIINSIEYKKVFKRDLEVNQLGPPYTGVTSYQISGFIRDDISSKKVYAIDWVTDFFDNCPNGEEHLLYDFSLLVGDSTNLCLYPQMQKEITAIQYLHIYNQEVKSFFTGSEYFYEGIGSDYGLFEEMVVIEYYSTTLDYYCPGTPCEYLVSAPEIIIPEYFDLYPNPAINIINLKFDQRENWQNVQISNDIGTLNAIYDITKGTGYLTIHLEGLTPGVYFCRLTSKNSMSQLKKFIVIK